MSRRKQAFPVRVEGNRLHLSVEPGSSCFQKFKEPDSSKILQDECNINIPTDIAHVKPGNTLSNGEFIATNAIYNEPKTNVLELHDESKTNVLVCDDSKTTLCAHEQNFCENEIKVQVALPSVKVEPSIILDDDLLIVSAHKDSSCVAKEEDSCMKDFCAFQVDKQKQCENVINAQVLQPQCQSHSRAERTEICRDLNVRTSLVCRAGTEIKIIQNTCAEKVKVHCVTNLTENAFEIHKKTPKQICISPHKTKSLETTNENQLCAEQEDIESKEIVQQSIFSCAEGATEEPEPLIISSDTDSVSIIKKTSLSTFCVSERNQHESIISPPEPDSSTIPLDECDLNITDEVTCSGSPNVHSNGEMVVTSALCDEPNTSAYTDDEQSVSESEAKSQLIFPPIKIEPCIILNEEQEPLNIPACSDYPSVIKEEDLSTDDEEQIENIPNIHELIPLCLTHGHACCGCKEVEKTTEMCSDSGEGASLIDKDSSQNLCAEKVEIQSLTKFMENTFKTEEQNHLCIEPENFLESEEPPLEAILPCVDVNLSLLKEEQEPLIITSCKSPVPIIQEPNPASFPIEEKIDSIQEVKPLRLTRSGARYSCQEVERAAKMRRDLNVKTSSVRNTKTGINVIQKNCAEKQKVAIRAKSKGNASKAGRKRRQRTRGSHRKDKKPRPKNRAPQIKKQSHAYTKLEESPLQAILPCDDVDPSLLTDEPEPLIISACKDPVPIVPETNLIFPVDESGTFENSTDAIFLQSDDTEHSEVDDDKAKVSEDSTTSSFELHIPKTRASRRKRKPCVTDEEIRCMVDFTKEALDQRSKKLQQIRDAVYKKRASETDEQRQARLEKDKLRQRKRRAEETDEQREKRLLTMRLHKRIKRSMHSHSAAGLQKNFLDYYMEEMFKYPETQEEQGSPLRMIVSIDPSWVVRTVEKQQFKCAVETEEQRKVRLEKDMMRQRKKRAEETPEQRAKRLETMRINKRIRRAMETEEQRSRRLEYSRERQLFRRLNETEQQRKERLEREKMRQREKRATESSEERALRLQAARERMRMRLSNSEEGTDILDNLLSSDSLSS